MSVNEKKVYFQKDLLPGMCLGADIIKSNGKVLLSEGTLLTANIIERLGELGVEKITIIQVSEGLSDFERPISETQEKFCAEYSNVVHRVKMTFEAVRKFKRVPGKEIHAMIEETILPLMHTVGAINYLNQEKPMEEYTFYHSVNTAIVAGLLAQWMGYNRAQITEVMTAGLLHDVGKTQIPLEILNKPEKLSPEEMAVMRQHGVHGYKLVSEAHAFSADVALVALQHHERLDGTGYPARSLNEKIHPYAKVIAIADIYDAMTSNRVYSEKVTPFVVVETLVAEMYGKLDPDICHIFLNSLRDYFIGNIVELSDGREAEIVFQGQDGIAGLIVRTHDGAFITLGDKNNITISKVLR
jgi:putative nucleotidyltransferase with HDIG domain